MDEIFAPGKPAFEASDGASWEGWIQDVGKTVVSGYASANWTQPFELEKLKIKAQAQNGGYYTEGMPVSNQRGGISPMVLLLAGAAIVAIVMLRD